MRLRDLARLCLVGSVWSYVRSRDRRHLQPARDLRAVRHGPGADGLSLGRRAAGAALLAEPRRLHDPARRSIPASHVAHAARSRSATPTTARDALDVLWLQPRAEPLPAGFARQCCRAARAPRGMTEGMTLDSVEADAGQERRRRPAADQRHARADHAARAAPARRAPRRCASPIITPSRRTRGAAAPAGWIARTARSTRSRNGIRAWPSMTTSAAGTRCPTSQQEFYLEYGDFDYSVTVPANYDRRRLGRAGERGGGPHRRSSARAWRRRGRATRR